MTDTAEVRFTTGLDMAEWKNIIVRVLPMSNQRGPKKWSDAPKVTQEVSGRDRN